MRLKLTGALEPKGKVLYLRWCGSKTGPMDEAKLASKRMADDQDVPAPETAL